MLDCWAGTPQGLGAMSTPESCWDSSQKCFSPDSPPGKLCHTQCESTRRLRRDPSQVKTLNFLWTAESMVVCTQVPHCTFARFVDAQFCICLSVALGSGPCAPSAQLLMSQVRLEKFPAAHSPPLWTLLPSHGRMSCGDS